MDNTVILNLYRRPDYLEEQIAAIREQSVAPSEIWLWVNGHEDNEDLDLSDYDLDAVVRSDRNFKYHGRFALGLLATTQFVSFFDDDTIPGKDWFKNCIDSYKKQAGIYGGAGVVLMSPYYHQHQRVGWPSNNEEITRVDLVGHAWFMNRQDLRNMWIELPWLENGEDIQLAYQAQKYSGLNCYCPPHPKDKPEMSSSLKAWEYGNDDKASSNGSLKGIPKFYEERDKLISHCVKNGWQPINQGKN